MVWDGDTEQQKAVEPPLFMAGRGMHILAEEKDRPNSDIDLRSADVSAPHV